MAEILKTQLVDKDQSVAPEPVQLAGYTLEGRLGTGGYGEVWRAIGPGGLPKAVKILFGQMDGPQADAELKALHRMRDLRHPFLLSIERIEVVDGRLVVVTELADGCLDDRFNALRAEGQRGIPRDELLGYLRDTADALDFMFEEHGLQHLDIKPENLMLQGKHVKVGDFGLAKDIRSATLSLVGGFTPLYAPPEIYEGQPSPASDQYSLAIVYQVMLTGVAPFSGRTAAQLTAQHLRSSPDLSSLQPVDRPVIARALSKNPNARFSSCRQFVEELHRRRNSRSRANGSVTSSRTSSQTTDIVKTAMLSGSDELQSCLTEPIRPLCQSLPLQHRPTLFVGVGGLGGEVLRSVKTEFVRRFGTSDLGAYSMLYVDTSRSAIEAQRSRPELPFSEEEVLAIPLRHSSEYRKDSNLRLEWLSRRWLFNMPKTGEVDGIRPLGRLAVMDHEVRVRDSLNEAIARTTSDEAVAESASSLGLVLDPTQLDIIVVGSISGGAASGSLIDVASMARDAATHAGITGAQVHGVLMHGTSSQRQMGDIQDANAMSCLRELLHYRTPSLGEADPFDSAYLVHLGDSIVSTEFNARANRVADYLFRTTATDSQKWVDSWREHEQKTSNSPSAIRTFGIASIRDSVFSLVSREAESLAYAAAHYWVGSGDATPIDRTGTGLVLTRLGLTEDRLSKHVLDILRGESGREIDSYAHARITEIGLDAEHGPAEVARQIEAGFATDDRVSRILNLVLQTFPQDQSDAIQWLEEYVLSLLDQPGRISGAAAAMSDIRQQLVLSATACRKLQQDIEQGFDPLRDALRGLQSGEGQDAGKLCHQYCVLRFYKAVYQQLVEYVDGVLASISKMDDRLREFRTGIRSFAQSILSSGNVPSSQPNEVVAAFDGQVLTNNRFHLRDLFGGIVTAEHSRDAILADASAFLLANTPRTAGAESESGFPESASPELSNIGGKRRVLGLIPEDADAAAWKTKLQEHFGDCVTMEEDGSSGELTVLCEIEGISIDQVLANFGHKNPRLVEVSGRVHTRVDIDW